MSFLGPKDFRSNWNKTVQQNNQFCTLKNRRNSEGGRGTTTRGTTVAKLKPRGVVPRQVPGVVPRHVPGVVPITFWGCQVASQLRLRRRKRVIEVGYIQLIQAPWNMKWINKDILLTLFTHMYPHIITHVYTHGLTYFCTCVQRCAHLCLLFNPSLTRSDQEEGVKNLNKITFTQYF
jgi:hypothetical protein